MSDDMETKARELHAEIRHISREYGNAPSMDMQARVSAAILRAFAEQRREGAREVLRETSREFRRHGLGAEPPAEIHGEDDARREAWDDAADWCDMRRAQLKLAPAPARTVTFPALPIDPEADALADRIVEDRWRGKVARPLAPTTARDERCSGWERPDLRAYTVGDAVGLRRMEDMPARDDAGALLDASMPESVVDAELHAMGLDPDALRERGAVFYRSVMKRLGAARDDAGGCGDCGDTGIVQEQGSPYLTDERDCPSCTAPAGEDGEQ